MKLIITEEQLRMIIESENKGKLMIIPGELLEDKDSFYRMYKLYIDNKESKNYVGIRVIGDFNLLGVLGGNLSSELIDFCGDLLQVDGDLRVINNYVVSFPKLRKVSGDMTLSMTEVRSLPELRYVGRNLTLNRSKISELPELESVGGSLDLRYTPIESLPMLSYVGGDLDLYDSQIESLPMLEYVGDYLNLHYTPLSETTTEEELRQQINVEGVINI